ncbi:hypothetical protein RB195_003049 [Necator americanus]|uniref:Neurotransmitter-gated ion-channel ligand-binding domain-containing protein n=1 Tax=Necator americanus TaxID=51031 RepID=A0ABR1DN57_NECAM
MNVEYISNFDFAKQTFDIIVEVEQSLATLDSREVRETMQVEKTANLFHDIRFDAIDSRIIGYDDHAVQLPNITGMRRREMLTIPCQFSHYFPFDSHTCLVKMISRRYPSDKLLLKWRAPQHITTAPLNVPYFILNKMTQITCMHNSGVPSALTSSSTYGEGTSVSHSCLAVRFEFSRPLCIAMYRFYVPTSLVLFLTWLSFYVTRSDLVSRILLVSISISLQIFLGCFFIYFSALHITVTTPADVWCTLLAFQSAVVVIFLFMSMTIEFRVRKYHDLSIGSKDVRDESRSRHERQAMRSVMYRKESDNPDKSACSTSTVVESRFRRFRDKFSLYAARMDIVARVACPLIYVVLTSLYFLLYLLSPYE